MTTETTCIEGCGAHAPSNAQACAEHCKANARKMLRNATQRNATNATTTYVEIFSLRNASRAMETGKISRELVSGSVQEGVVSPAGVAVDARSAVRGLSVPEATK